MKTFVREFIQCRTFLRVLTESVTLSPRFIPESVFYTQSVMLSPRFIPESVFYTQSVVRSPQSVFCTDRLQYNKLKRIVYAYHVQHKIQLKQ